MRLVCECVSTVWSSGSLSTFAANQCMQESTRSCCCEECTSAPRLLRPARHGGNYLEVAAYASSPEGQASIASVSHWTSAYPTCHWVDDVRPACFAIALQMCFPKRKQPHNPFKIDELRPQQSTSLLDL